MRLRPNQLIIALVAAAALAAGGCSATSEDSGGGPAEPSTEGITLYSGRIPAAIGGAVDMYEAEADRDVQVRYGETGDLAATLVEEGDNSPADVFFAQEPGAIGAVADRGLLAKLPHGHPRPGAAAVPRPGRALGRGHRPRQGDRVRAGREEVRAAGLAVRLHRPDVERARRLVARLGLAAAVRDRNAAALRRRRRRGVGQGNGRTTTPRSTPTTSRSATRSPTARSTSA